MPTMDNIFLAINKPMFTQDLCEYRRFFSSSDNFTVASDTGGGAAVAAPLHFLGSRRPRVIGIKLQKFA